ncbi:MAG: P-loop NTPase fold protein [Crocinitomicaceae bacterium]|nr:P-loop NTPase fold protein [Crocinitomicaceae bacterium]
MDNFRFKISDIKYEASRLYSLKLSEDELFTDINKISKDKLESLASTYQGSEGKPVNFMRWRIIKLLQDGTKVTKEMLENMIEQENNAAEKNSFKAWGHFSILFPIISEELTFNIKEMMREFGNELIAKLDLGDHVAKPFVVDFKGPRNFGSDNVWMAIYNKSNPKQTTAVQMFIQIDYRGLICHLYDRLKDHFISSRKIEDSDDMESQVESFFNALKDKVIEDTNDPSEVRYRELGVKTNKIFKISHGTKFFPSLQEIQYCIDQNIVVVHEDTGPKGRGDATQYESFKQAKPGDLFYLCWGNSRFLLIGQFVDDVIEDYEYPEDKGWKKRKYRFIYDAISDHSFSGSKKWWTPNDPSTCVQIPSEEYELANELIFKNYFKVELKTDFDTALLPPKLGAAARQKISIDEIVEPKLEVSLIARELTGVIDNLDKNKGQMIGIFGSWGRGKTFLYNRMRDHIDDNKDLRFEYEHYTFNAWKYQETETIWAHLYDSLLEGYIGKANRWQKFWKTFSLNIARKGWFPLVSIIFNLIVTTILTYMVSTAVKFEVAKWLVTIFGGAVGVLQAVYIYWRFYQPVKTTVEAYTSLHNYNEILGIQSEIQKELIDLVQHWLKNAPRGKIRKRLLLFVDDIDRCQEEKIISVMDALRVMLDDDELIKRIVVLVAVDEKLLDRAINFKYRNFKFEDQTFSKNLVEEYMDKLFIAGIKLPKLNEEEQGVILRNYAINNDILERVTPTEPVEDDVEEGVQPKPQDAPADDLIFPEANPREYIESQSEYFLLEKELEVLNKYSNKLSVSVTPRQLRIYMYRYLLAKNIASDYLWQKTGESQLSDEYCDFLARAIAYRSNNAHSFGFDNDVSLSLVENPTLEAFTPKLVEIVVPY